MQGDPRTSEAWSQGDPRTSEAWSPGDPRTTSPEQRFADAQELWDALRAHRDEVHAQSALAGIVRAHRGHGPRPRAPSFDDLLVTTAAARAP